MYSINSPYYCDNEIEGKGICKRQCGYCSRKFRSLEDQQGPNKPLKGDLGGERPENEKQ